MHAAADLAGVHVALYPAHAPGRAPSRRAAGSTFAGLYVASLDDALAATLQVGAPLSSGHEKMPWGCRFVAEDPDGRAVEVNDRSHCAEPAA